MQIQLMPPELKKAYEEIERLRVCLKYAGLYAFCTKYLKDKKDEETGLVRF
jgi:hypothetical protein